MIIFLRPMKRKIRINKRMKIQKIKIKMEEVKTKSTKEKKCLNKCRFKSPLNNFRIPIGRTP